MAQSPITSELVHFFRPRHDQMSSEAQVHLARADICAWPAGEVARAPSFGRSNPDKQKMSRSQLMWERDRGESVANLEIYLRAELEDPWIERRSHLPKVARTQCIAYLVELGVVPDVEALRAKLQPPSLTELEAFEEREIPVVTARAAQGVETCIAPGA